MVGSQQLCDICDHRHIKKPSIVWCPECEQAFCDDCKNYHGLSRLSQHHITVSIQSYLAMPLSISQNSIMCMEHNEQYQMVCQAHNELVCPSCILNHDDCKGIVPLKKVIEHVKKSSLLQETKQSLKDIDQNIKMLQNELKKQQGSIKHQEETVFAKIRETRHKVIAHLDKLEKKIRNEVSEITAKLINNMKQTIQLLESRNTNIHIAEQQLQNMDRYGTDIQAYLGLRRISSEAASSCTYLQSIIADHGVHKITLLFNIDDKINNIYKSIGTFASIKIQKDTCHIPLVTHKNKQAQLVGTISKSIPAIKIRHVKTTKTGVSNIRGIVSLASGNIALSNYVRSDAGKVVIFSIDGGELMKVPVKPASSFDISYIDDRFLATTSPFIENKGVIIIDIDEKKAAKFIPTNFQCYGIKHYDGLFYVCAFKEGIFEIDPITVRSTAIVKSNLPSWSYIDIFDNKLYYTNDDTKCVTCCDMDGKTVWTFKDVNILQTPRGIAVDKRGNVYVACSMLHRVVVLSHDGKQNRQLLSKADGLQSPCAIHIDIQSNILWVANGGQIVFTYEL